MKISDTVITYKKESLAGILMILLCSALFVPNAYATGDMQWNSLLDPLFASYRLTDGGVGGTQVLFEVLDDDLNLDGSVAIPINVKVTTTSDPTGITLTLNENGADNGMFTNSNLVFMTDNARFQITDTATITIEDKCGSLIHGNCDAGAVETLTGGVDAALVISETDNAGVSVSLTETGPNTGIFTGKLQFTTGPSDPLSVPPKLQVTAGDIISVYDEITFDSNNGLILPSTGDKGAILADIGDTATITYTLQDSSVISDDIAIVNDGASGRGGGGLVRPGLVVDAIAPSVASTLSSGSSDCVGDCYPPHFGMDKFGSNIYDDGLTINGTVYDINNDFHTAPDKILDLPVGKLVTFVVKSGDTDPDQITHGELSIGIPKGDFNKQEGTFIINIDKTFPDGFTTKVEGDRTAFRQLSTELKVDEKNAYFIYSFIPTRHLPYDMFAIYVRDVYGYEKLTFVNHGVFFRGISETGTPVYDVFDDKGRMSTITILDKTLEDLTVAIDQDGKIWRLDKDGFWEKDFEKPENYCMVTTHTFDRYCPEFKNMVLGQQLIAKQYFDSSQVQNVVKPYIASADYSDYPRLHDSLSNMMKAQSDYLKSKLE